MSNEIRNKIGNISQVKANVKFKIMNESLETVHSGAANTDSSGNIVVGLEGVSSNVGDSYVMLVHDFDGENYDSFGHAMFPVYVSEAPALKDFTYAIADYTVSFYNPDGLVGAWFIDGNVITEDNPVYVFENGTYTVTLEGANSRTFTIDVASDTFTYVINGNSVQFYNPTGNNGQWNFGDGSLSSAIDPVHVFENGQYSVSLEGATTRPIVIYVEDAPAGTPQEGVKLLAFGDSFTDNASNNSYTGKRLTNQGVSINQRGYWTASAYVYAESDYVFRPDMGKSGNGTSSILARVPDVLATDADVVIMMMGVNDTTATGTDITPTVTNYTDSLNQLVSGGKKVLVVPSTYRNDWDDPSIANDFLDRMNAAMLPIIASIDGVEVSPLNQEYNTLLMADSANYSGISDDGLHPNNRGGLLEGKVIASSLDHFFPSYIAKVNLLPDSFSGDDGALVSSAVGIAPSGMRAFYANNSLEDAFQGPIDRGDGRVWWKIVTEGGTPTSYNNKSRFQYDNVAAAAGMYVAEATVVLKNASALTKLRLAGNSETSTYYLSDNTVYNGTTDTYEDDVEYRLRTPSFRVSTSEGVNCYLDTEQELGVNCEVYITDMMIYKVEELTAISS